MSFYQSEQLSSSLGLHLNIGLFDPIVGNFEIHLVRQYLVNAVWNTRPANVYQDM